jgi:hypothetical protein
MIRVQICKNLLILVRILSSDLELASIYLSEV